MWESILSQKLRCTSCCCASHEGHSGRTRETQLKRENIKNISKYFKNCFVKYLQDMLHRIYSIYTEYIVLNVIRFG